MATSTARRRAKKSAQGQRQLPKATTSRARKAASFIGPFHEDDREWVIKIKLAGWWDNGRSLDNFRRGGSAESLYRYSNEELVPNGVPDNIINILSYRGGQGNRNFSLYADHDTA